MCPLQLGSTENFVEKQKQCGRLETDKRHCWGQGGQARPLFGDELEWRPIKVTEQVMYRHEENSRRRIGSANSREMATCLGSSRNNEEVVVAGQWGDYGEMRLKK